MRESAGCLCEFSPARNAPITIQELKPTKKEGRFEALTSVAIVTIAGIILIQGTATNDFFAQDWALCMLAVSWMFLLICEYLQKTPDKTAATA